MKVCIVMYAEGIDGPDEVRLVSDREAPADDFFRSFTWQRGLYSDESMRLEVWSRLADGSFRRERIETRMARSEQAEAIEEAEKQWNEVNGHNEDSSGSRQGSKAMADEDEQEQRDWLRHRSERASIEAMDPKTAKAILVETVGALYCALEGSSSVPDGLHPADIISKHIQRGNLLVDGMGDDPAQAALDEIAEVCGKPRPEYPSDVVDDVRALVAERDGFLAMAERRRKRADEPPPGFAVERVDLGDAWFLVRASGTQPLIRITAEARDERRADELAELGRTLVEDAA